MHSGHVTRVVLLALAIYVCNVQADQADVHIVTSGYCSKSVLQKRGVDTNTYKPQVIFDPKQVRLSPNKPTIPGCFRVIAKNVTLLTRVSQVTGEFEMRLSGDADPNKPILQCKKKQPKCGCGERDTCMYCDFCKNFKKFVKNTNVAVAPTGCDCNIAAGQYTIDAEVCTPDEKELSQNLPMEVLDRVSDGKSFSLFTTLFIYNFRFNSLVNSDDSQAARNALKARKARGLIGCYVIGSNISV